MHVYVCLDLCWCGGGWVCIPVSCFDEETDKACCAAVLFLGRKVCIFMYVYTILDVCMHVCPRKCVFGACILNTVYEN